MTIKNFGDLKVGDKIIGSDGQPVEVVAVYDEHIPESMWEIETDEGFIKASGNHLWYVETEIDWSLHSKRKKDGKRLLKNLTKESIELLEESAIKKEEVETRLIDMITLVRASKSDELIKAIVRVAESIGHIAENTFTEQDLGGDGEEEQTIRSYDARIFAQQILALTGMRKYRHYELIVGSVMTTEDMVNLSEFVAIPKVKSLS